VRDIFDVDTTRSDVRGYQDAEAALLKAGQSGGALRL